MLRYLVLVAAGLWVTSLIERQLQRFRQQRSLHRGGSGSTPEAQRPQRPADQLVACARCGVHVARGRALPGKVPGTFVCSTACQQSTAS